MLNRRINVLLGCFAAFSVLLYASAHPLGQLLAARFGAVMLRVGKGKISDPVSFASTRLSEAGLLVALAVFLAAVYLVSRRFLAARQNSWAPLSLVLFVFVNIWLAVAMHTVLFWGAFYTGRSTSNFTQFHFKEHLLKEHKAPTQILLMGSSQTQAQIDENILNSELKAKAWTTELHFPGSHALDLLLVLRRLRGEPGDLVVCYVSEYYFYSGLFSTAAPYFLSAADIPCLRRSGWGDEIFSRQFALGFLAQALPVFACREPLGDRIFGVPLTSIAQMRHDTGLATNLVGRAKSTADVFKLDHNSDLQKSAFEQFVKEAAYQKRRVMLLEGQVNPLLAEQIPPTIRADMKRFLRNVAAQYPNTIILIPEEKMPHQTVATYQDLTHVTEQGQTDFSHWLAPVLNDYLRQTPRSPAVALGNAASRPVRFGLQ